MSNRITVILKLSNYELARDIMKTHDMLYRNTNTMQVVGSQTCGLTLYYRSVLTRVKLLIIIYFSSFYEHGEIV